MRPVQQFLFLLFISCIVPAYSQIVLTPLPRNPAASKSTARIKDVAPLKLPFWDDFSFASGDTPTDSLWQHGNSVWLNNGIGIDPPSLGVVTFDGLDSLGKPYNVNDVQAKGFADNLTSQSVRLDSIDPALKPTLFLSFYYQLKGRGEIPDVGDQLRLQMVDSDGAWETIWSVENDGTQQTDVFYQIMIAIPTDNDRFFHNKFQFRFQNFARLSGPYDTWNLDYIYLNTGRSQDDTSYPDRTISAQLTSLFKDYFSIPVKHFLKEPDSLLNHAEFTMYNLRVASDQPVQPINYYSYANITNYIDGTPTTTSVDLDKQAFTNGVNSLTQTKWPIATLPPVSTFDTSADSIEINFKLGLTTKDNLLPADDGDYNAAKYAPIDFRWNDTTRTTYHLSDYYAYDDGTAEYGAGVKGYGAQLMYQFDIKAVDTDTLVGMKVYFPRFGDESSQLIQLQVFRDLESNPGSSLYTETVAVQRSQNDQFVYYKFERFVGVPKTFYIGWSQSSSAVISVGLDKNSDTSNKIYFNTGGVWEQDSTNVTGSLMIRPVFGKGGVVVGLPENQTSIRSYPNPNNGVFFLSSEAERIQVIDLTGRDINFYSENLGDRYRLDLSTVSTGIYVVRYLIDGHVHTEKVIVQK